MSNESQVPLVLALDDASATLEMVGGKGASLARMAAAGLPVPAGFHITTAAYRCFVAEHGLQEEILSALSAASPNQPATLDAASQQIAALFAARTMPDAITTAIRQAYAKLGTGNQPVAVRSSATAEDLPEMSFAGQQETYLNMQGEAMVLDAVKRCWASLWTARAIGYRVQHGIAQEEVSLAVVVQELVPAEAAGILFTANPLTGARDQVMINAAWGLGEAIVSGQVSPDTLLVDKANLTIIQQDVSEKEVMTVRTPTGTHEEAVPAEKRNQPVLSPAQAAALARIAVQIEQLYARPMDIEWTFHDAHFSIVQARPITALPDPPASQALPTQDMGAQSRSTQSRGAVDKPDTAWKLPKPNGKYMRASVMELLPDPLSPLFATLGLPIWNRATHRFGLAAGMGHVSSDMLTTINGYAFYDLSYRMALTKPTVMVTVVPRLMYTAQQRWEQEARPAYKAVAERWEAVKLSRASAAELLVGTREILNAAASYYLTIQGGILPAAYLTETIFTAVYEKLLKRRADPPALTFMLGYDSAPIRAEESLYDLAQWVRTQDDLSTVLQNMSGAQF